jgi:hypothetical protein
MSAAMQTAEAITQPPVEHRGRFKKGYDPRRHKFTADECSAGFWAAIESIITRYPDAIMPDGRHMVANFLKAVTKRKPKRVN